MRVAIIPARGGSKRILRKNIKHFCGKPMIAYSIEAAKESGLFDRIVVSTDDAEIADVAQDYGAQIPFMRPKELSDDHTPTIPVIAHAIQMLEQDNISISSACCIYATAPFIEASRLSEAYELHERSQSAYTFSATTYAFPIQRAFKRDANGTIAMFHPEHFNTRSQDLEEAYHDAGQFYWGKRDAWLHALSIFAPHSNAIILPRYRVQDIDTMEDWKRAELMYKALAAL